MTWSRDNGTATPTYAGMAMWNGYRINDGTAKSTVVPPLISQPPIRDAGSDLPSDDGGTPGVPFLSRWEFDLEGFLWVPTGMSDLWLAIADLKNTFNLAHGPDTLTLQELGGAHVWRMLAARVAGPVSIVEPGIDQKKVPRRDFVIPMVVEDPRQYNDATLQTVVFNPGDTKTLTNNGNYPTPFIVEFDGSTTNPSLETTGGARIRLTNADATNYTIASTHFVRVSTYPNAPTGITALDDTGANVYSKVASRSAAASVIPPGSTSWTFNPTSGAGQAIVTFRDARI